MAEFDGLIDGKQRDAFRGAGTEPCSRLDEVGWGGLTTDDVQAAVPKEGG